MTRDDIVQLILTERARQFNLPGREFDVTNSPNDWVAIIASYSLDCITRNHRKPDVHYYEESLVKAAAVILAALEHMDMMKKEGHFQ